MHIPSTQNDSVFRHLYMSCTASGGCVDVFDVPLPLPLPLGILWFVCCLSWIADTAFVNTCGRLSLELFWFVVSIGREAVWMKNDKQNTPTLCWLPKWNDTKFYFNIYYVCYDPFYFLFILNGNNFYMNKFYRHSFDTLNWIFWLNLHSLDLSIFFNGKTQVNYFSMSCMLYLYSSTSYRNFHLLNFETKKNTIQTHRGRHIHTWIHTKSKQINKEKHATNTWPICVFSRNFIWIHLHSVFILKYLVSSGALQLINMNKFIEIELNELFSLFS